MKDHSGQAFCMGCMLGFLFGGLTLSVWGDYCLAELERKAVKAGVAHHEINQDTGRVELMFHPAK